MTQSERASRANNGFHACEQIANSVHLPLHNLPTALSWNVNTKVTAEYHKVNILNQGEALNRPCKQ